MWGRQWAWCPSVKLKKIFIWLKKWLKVIKNVVVIAVILLIAFGTISSEYVNSWASSNICPDYPRFPSNSPILSRVIGLFSFSKINRQTEVSTKQDGVEYKGEIGANQNVEEETKKRSDSKSHTLAHPSERFLGTWPVNGDDGSNWGDIPIFIYTHIQYPITFKVNDEQISQSVVKQN